MYEAMYWLVCMIAAVTILAATTAAILTGFALRFVAEFLREFGDGRKEGDVIQKLPAEQRVQDRV